MPVWFLLCISQRAAAVEGGWIATWAASLHPAGPGHPLLKIENQSVRQRVQVSLGGSQMRLRLSNESGSSPLKVGAVTLATPRDATSIQLSSLKAVTFGGRDSITIDAGGRIESDPIIFAVAPGSEISISIYFPERVSTPTIHLVARKPTIVSPPGDHTRDEKIEPATTSLSSILLSAVLVSGRPGQRLVAAFGDSITDGHFYTPKSNYTWVDALNRRLQSKAVDLGIALVNAGITGNRLLKDGAGASALARFERDALSLPGITHVVLLEGVNDIGFPGCMPDGRNVADPAPVPTREDLLAAYRRLIDLAHIRGIKVVGGTITPFGSAHIAGFHSEAKEAVRQAVNEWIRSSRSFDGIIDFDAILRDPDRPSRLLARYAGADELHPSDAGHRAVADAIDLSLFK